MKNPLFVIDIVGLTPALLGDNTPHLRRLASEGFMTPLEGVFPALTCSAQSSMLTGLHPCEHGIVGNGWYFRELAEVWLWRQSNHLVHGEKVWHAARKLDPEFTCAKMFWWYNMYADVDWSATPRPSYPADGRKLPGIYTNPPELEKRLQDGLGTFPLYHFWGPMADIRSSRWIAQSAIDVFDAYRPRLNLVYLPHLDYNLQRLGPSDPRIARDLREIDEVAGSLIDHARDKGADIMVVSEYGIEAVDRPIHVNRILRETGYVRVRETLGWELLDAGACEAFAVADHQVAHVYVKDPRNVGKLKQFLESVPGIARVLDRVQQREFFVDHPRSGELLLVAEAGHWFTYYYWLDDARAPDFAPTVDIHRKPGFDPAELFIDPDLKAPKLRIATRLLQKKLGMRYLLDVIALNGDQVRGSHGRLPDKAEHGPLLIVSKPELETERPRMTDIKQLILRMLA